MSDEEEDAEWRHFHGDFAVCPYCDYEDKDSWEIEDAEGGCYASCNSCGEEYFVTRNVSVTYTTEKRKKP